MTKDNKDGNTEKNIEIILNDSTYPHAFNNKTRIHQQEFIRAIKLIDEQYSEYENYTSPIDDVLRNRFHNTISLFGGRGTGKTSFLHSVLNHYKTTQPFSENIEVLEIIYPTTLEEKGHIFLYIISLINDCVNNFLTNKVSAQDSDVIFKKKLWNNNLLKLAKGLPSLDSLGTDYRNNNWQDNDFIMERGLEQVSCALNLETFFHKLVDQALTIVGKKFFMLAFDDIDVNIKKGRPILGCIRKYMTTPKIITLLSGNLKFYSNNIRIQQWEQISTLVKYEADKGRNLEMMSKLTSQVNEVEGQYLLKIFKAENRVHLHSIYDAINTYKWGYIIKDNENDEAVRITEKYKNILKRNNIYNDVSNDIFVNYLMGLSVCTQINFLRNNKDVEDLRNFKLVDTFLSRMYASKIDIDLIVNNPKMSNVVILEYLLRYNILQDSYLLLPTNDDENVNGCVTGLTFMLIDKFSTDSSIMFDYMLRIGYTRNILLSLNDAELVKRMCKYAGAYKDISLKNFIGLTIAFLASINENNVREHTAIYGLDSVGKRKKSINRIDTLLNHGKANPAQRIISLIPLCALKNVNTNGSKLYYSVFNLLAGICQIIKASADKYRIISELQSLQLLSYYPMNHDMTKKMTSYEARDLSDEVINEESGSDIDNLADALYEWVSSYNKYEKSDNNKGNNFQMQLPPYALGRIATRLFSVVSQIRQDNLGAVMHQNIIALLNACIIDEAREIYHKIDDVNKNKALLNLNYSNAVNSDKILTNNVKIINDFGWEYFRFTTWLLECPLIYAFLEPKYLKKITEKISGIKLTHTFSVYDILSPGLVKSDKLKRNTSGREKNTTQGGQSESKQENQSEQAHNTKMDDQSEGQENIDKEPHPQETGSANQNSSLLDNQLNADSNSKIERASETEQFSTPDIQNTGEQKIHSEEMLDDKQSDQSNIQ